MLDKLEEAANSKQNLMPVLLEAAHCYVSLGEICGVLRKVFGEYQQSTAL